MTNVIKLRKGLDINLKGKAKEEKLTLKPKGEIGLTPDAFTGVTPKVVVKEGDIVKAGDALFVNKQYPEVRFSSPVSGHVTAIVRGDSRVCIVFTCQLRTRSGHGRSYLQHLPWAGLFHAALRWYVG